MLVLCLHLPQQLGVLDHFLTHRVTIQMRNGLGPCSWWDALWVFGSIVAVSSVVAVSVAVTAVASVAVAAVSSISVTTVVTVPIA